MTEDIQSAKNHATTLRNDNDFFRLKKEERRLSQNSNRARRNWQHTRRREDKIIMNRTQQDLRNYLYKLKQENWQSYLTSLAEDDNSIWKAAWRFKSKFSPFPPIQKVNNTEYAYTNEDKATLLAIFLIPLFRTRLPIYIHSKFKQLSIP